MVPRPSRQPQPPRRDLAPLHAACPRTGTAHWVWNMGFLVAGKRLERMTLRNESGVSDTLFLAF